MSTNDPDHERLREIEASARTVDRLADELKDAKYEATLARQRWEEAVERHLELCRATEDSQDVAKSPLLRRIEELGAEANGQPFMADAVTADHEEDEPDLHGEPVVSDLSGHRIADWHEQDAKAEADALAKIEAGSAKAKGRKRSKAK